MTTPDRRFPPMPLTDWAETRDTLHRFLQIVGKIRLATAPRRNHWWNVPFHLTGRGLTTRPMGTEVVFAIDFDFLDHHLRINTTDGGEESIPLAGQSVATFYESTMTALGRLGCQVVIAHPEPFDLAEPIPFADDTRHANYDAKAVTRYWQVLSRVNLLLEDFAGAYSGKTSPVHHFWHGMDIALTRFSAQVVDHAPSADGVTREAYSREVVSFGFWFGDPGFPEPAFYSYTAPEPFGVADAALEPPGAEWQERNGSHLAIYRYDDARATGDVRSAALAFWEAAYQAGAGALGWDVDALASPGGITAG